MADQSNQNVAKGDESTDVVGVINEYNRIVYSHYREKFLEMTEMTKLFNNIKNDCNNLLQVERSMDRIQYIMTWYQEQPHLLDPVLETMINHLLGIVRNPELPDKAIHVAFKYFYLITKVRGYKDIVRNMPHEVSDLEEVLALLNKQNPNDHQSWETRYMLLLWLSMVCMIPFDMVRLDSNIRLQTGETKQPIMDRIINEAKQYLKVPDKSRDAAAYALSRFMTRPDVKKQKLPEFLDWLLVVMKTADRESMAGTFEATGAVSTLALLLKHGKRDDLMPYAANILQALDDLAFWKSVNTHIRKLHIKVVQRLGLTFLKARQASWRYQRGCRSLADNLKENQPLEGNTVSETTSLEEEDEDFDIPDEIEDVMDQLLRGLKDPDTIVRWSAAKGIGRLTGRLPRELGDEVVGSLMELFTVLESDAAWHGGCLSLAELGRRGLLVPERLSDVIPVILRALKYDEKRGNFSVGAHVRDAACYVCWAFARAYDPKEMLPHVNKLAGALLTVSVFDREVNVRRAASAAFQENVGRQGQFPHGIDILTVCDYFAVGNIITCYKELSVFIGQFPEYTQVLIDHLVDIKVSHWDSSIRELAAHGLHNLTVHAPEYMAKTALPKLLCSTDSFDLFLRHGSIICSSEIIHALYKISQKENRKLSDMIGQKCLDDVKAIAKKLSDAEMFKGLSGDLTRMAVCWMIGKVSKSNILYLNDPIVELWFGIINEGLDNLMPEVQAASIAALPAYFSAYFSRPDEDLNKRVRENIIDPYLKGLSADLEITRMGNALALGAIPKFILQCHLQVIFEGLMKATTIDEKHPSWAESRRDAIKSLARVSCEMGVSPSGGSGDGLSRDLINQVYSTLFTAMEDYTMDSRGDVGAWAREASMSALHEITSMIVKVDPSIISQDISEKMFSHFIKQAVEKIDRTRALAGNLFKDLLYHSPEIPHVPHREKLKDIFSVEVIEYLNWGAPSVTFPLFKEVLSLPTYRSPTLLGFTISVGGITESLVKYSSSSLLSYLNNISPQEMQEFTNQLLAVFKSNLKVTRISVPLLKMLDLLLANNVFSSFAEDPNHPFTMELLTLTRQEIARTTDVQKLLASIDVFCGLLQFGREVKNKALYSLCVLLCHRFPKVRKVTANKFYEAVVMYDGTVEDEALDEVMTLLSETLWDSAASNVKPVRDQLCDLLNIQRVKPAKPKENKE